MAKKQTHGMALAALAAGLLLSGTAVSAATDNKMGPKEGEIKCGGINSCKGQTNCMSASNQCKGQNSCKGKGWLSMPKEKCAEAGGQEKV